MTSIFINRNLESIIHKTKKSVLLLGPRQVGKSTLVSGLDPDVVINLSDEMEFLKHSSQPGELKNLIDGSKNQTIFIDEIQRLPKMLNTIQSIIDENKMTKFFLTGSSARKLKRGGANLLPGRVINYNLGPLVASELDYKINTARALSVGTLPEIYLNSDEDEALGILKSYVGNYLKEEIKAEALTRNIESFSRFLLEVSLCNSQFVDYTKLAKLAKISRHAIPRYFEILEDTLVGYRIEPLQALVEKEDLIKHPKFYYFDTGVYNSLVRNFEPSLDRIGILSEQLVFNQLMHSAWSRNKEIEISSFRTRKGIEVDFVAKLDGKYIGIEVKSNDNVSSDDAFGLNYLSDKFSKVKSSYIFHMGRKEQKIKTVWSLPWQKGLKELGL